MLKIIKIIKINWKIIAFILFIVASSFMVSRQSFINEIAKDDRTIVLIGVILSILTTSLISIITICSDTSHLDIGEKDWKIIWDKSKRHLSSIKWLQIIFYIYLTTICLLVIAVVIVKLNAVNCFWVLNVFAFMTTSSILSAFILPYEVIRIQSEKLSGKIAFLKNGDG